MVITRSSICLSPRIFKKAAANAGIWFAAV
jgi:hypothetical protein